MKIEHRYSAVTCVCGWKGCRLCFSHCPECGHKTASQIEESLVKKLDHDNLKSLIGSYLMSLGLEIEFEPLLKPPYKIPGQQHRIVKPDILAIQPKRKAFMIEIYDVKKQDLYTYLLRQRK